MPNKTKNDRILAVFFIKNKSNAPIDGLKFKFENTPNFRVIPHPQRKIGDPIPVDFSLQPQAGNTFKLPFLFKSFTQPQQLRGDFFSKFPVNLVVD